MNSKCRKDCCCFTDCISSCTAICWVNPHGFSGTAGVPVPMTDSLTTRTNRIQNHAPDNRTHAAVNPPVSNFWCATMSAHQNPDPADQELSGAAQDTKGSPTYFQDTASRFELIRLHVRLLRSASHSAIAIFRPVQPTAVTAGILWRIPV